MDNVHIPVLLFLLSTPDLIITLLYLVYVTPSFSDVKLFLPKWLTSDRNEPGSDSNKELHLYLALE